MDLARGIRRAHHAMAETTRRRRTLAAVELLGGCAFLNLYVTQPLLPLFQHLFHATPKAVSLTMGASVLAVAISAPFTGMVADAIGRKRVIVAALLGLAIPSLLAATARDLHELVVWRFPQGLCIPGVVATTMAYITFHSTTPEAVWGRWPPVWCGNGVDGPLAWA